MTTVRYITASGIRPLGTAPEQVLDWLRTHTDALPDRIDVQVDQMDNGLLLKIWPTRQPTDEATAQMQAMRYQACLGAVFTCYDSTDRAGTRYTGFTADRISTDGSRVGALYIDFSTGCSKAAEARTAVAA